MYSLWCKPTFFFSNSQSYLITVLFTIYKPHLFCEWHLCFVALRLNKRRWRERWQLVKCNTLTLTSNYGQFFSCSFFITDPRWICLWLWQCAKYIEASKCIPTASISIWTAQSSNYDDIGCGLPCKRDFWRFVEGKVSESFFFNY